MSKCKECQELKNKIEFMEEYIKTVENARDELERENNFLKEENAEIRKYQYEQDFLQQQLDQLKAENEELKQTLIEIQQDLEFATYCESQECGCDDANECLECTKNQILQKISECEV